MTENDISKISPEDLEQVTGGTGKSVVATKSGVSIHSGPGASFSVVGHTTKGAIATYAEETVFAEGKTWIRVTRGSKESGWICADYVKAL